MFIRIKKINGNDYAYHVHNKRVRGKIRQKVKSYLGKAIIASKTKDLDFFSFVKKDLETYTAEKSYRDIIYDLVIWELSRHDINDVDINLKRYSVTKEGSAVVIKMNEGYMYNKILNHLLKFQAVGDDEYFIGKEFAEAMVKAGIDAPKELFVKLFEKLHTN